MSARRQKKHVSPAHGDFSRLVAPYQAKRWPRYIFCPEALPDLWITMTEDHEFNWRITARFWQLVWNIERALQPMRKWWLR
jgi:hypothetical protein